MKARTPFLIVLTIACATGAQARSGMTDEEVVRSQDDRERIAALKRDIPALEQLWSEQITINAPNNRVVVGRRANMDTFVRSGIINFSSFDRTIESIKVDDDFAVIMGLETVVPITDAPSAGLVAGRPVKRRFTNVWKEEGETWRLYWRHANVIPIAGQVAPQPPADEAAIQSIVQNETDTWNKGDAVGYSKDFAANGTFTNIRGQFFTGYDGFLKQHQVIFDGIFKNTTLSQRVVSLKFVRPDVAIVETLTAVAGVTQPPTGVVLHEGRLRTRLLQIVVRDNGVWKIVTYHNTDVKPGIPVTEP
jgi:uncharacterized protein (TIGR02246 family)